MDEDRGHVIDDKWSSAAFMAEEMMFSGHKPSDRQTVPAQGGDEAMVRDALLNKTLRLRRTATRFGSTMIN